MTGDRSAAPARVRNRWGEGERLRGEILNAASRLLSGMEGEDGLTIRGVAREAAIAPASIYQHFADRAALVQGLLEYEFGRLQVLMHEADEEADSADMIGRLRAQLHAYCAFAIENPGHYRLMLSSGVDRTEPMLDVITMVSAAFGRCEEAGHALRLPSDRAAVIVVVGVHGRVALLQSSAVERSPRAVEEFIDELLALTFA
jgi:AcrR family transcriptional regulator